MSVRAATVFLTALLAAGCSKEAPPPLDPIWVNFSVLYAENELFAADPLVPQPKEAVK